MPAPVEIESTVLVTVVGRLCGQTTMTTFPYYVTQITGAPPNQGPGYIALYNALSVAGKLLAEYWAACPPNWVQEYVWFQQIRSVRYRKVVVTAGESGGFDDNDATTANVQASITRVGQLANRHELGGIRMPSGTAPTYHTDGIITVGYKAALDNLADEMSVAVTASGVQYTPLVGVQAPTYPVTFCEDAFPQNTTRVIRRRTVGLGI